jgi:predicted flap endonuclease-1-like 5' DNA nuclease
MLMTLLSRIAQHLEVPQELVLKFREYPGEDKIVVLLTDYRKMEVPHSLVVETAVPTDDPIEPLIGLTTPSHAQQLHDQVHPPATLLDIVGLGRTSDDRLQEAGITTLQQLLDTDPKEIAAIVKQNITTVKNWQKQAAALLGV